MSKLFKKFIDRIKTKNGNSFLFMPAMITFGTSLLYMSMEMGTAYVRQIELQSVTDAVSRAGVYAGMTGSGVTFYKEGEHVYVNLDDAVALAIAQATYKYNVKNITSLQSDATAARPGQYVVTNVAYCQKNAISQDREIPVWTRTDDTTGDGYYTWTKVSTMSTPDEVMSTGNFYVTIEGQYKTLVRSSILGGSDVINIEGFASALATATSTRATP